MRGVLSRPPIFWPLAVLFGAFVVFLYGPIATIGILACQGPDGGLGDLEIETDHTGLGGDRVETRHSGLRGQGVAIGHGGFGHHRFESRRFGRGLYAYSAECELGSAWTYSGYCNPNCYPSGCYGY